MTHPDLPPAFRGRRLVVFDMDGTLYRQAPLRRRMALALALHAVRRRDTTTARVLIDYRRRREALADAGTAAFDVPLVEGCARACGVSPDTVRGVVAEWIERRPLSALPHCAVAGARELIDSLRQADVRVAVWSDYPVRDKMTALGLEADFALSATDPELERMKPDPRGLAMLMEQGGVKAHETLMVGDRDERDGAAAQALGVDFLRRSDRAKGGDGVRDFTSASLKDARPASAGGKRP